MRTIVLCDDHPFIRAGLRELIDNLKDCTVVAEAENGNDVLAVLDDFKPDIMITDLTMPGIPVLDLIKQAKRSMPALKIIVLSMHNSDDFVRGAFSAGADGYVSKDEPSEILQLAISEVMDGRRYLNSTISKALDSHSKGSKRGKEVPISVTVREKQVLSLAAQGFSSTEIAERLRISHRTAETHRANLMRKLGLHSQTDLVHFAFRSGLIEVGR